MVRVTIEQLLKQCVDYLKINGVRDFPVLDAQLILCKVLGVGKLYLVTHKDEKLDMSAAESCMELIRLRAKGMPVQYIIGEQEFMSLPFKVTPDVLIPRPDTEILVEHVIEECQAWAEEDIRIMDIGTGSGCIAVSLAYYIKNSRVWAVDISPRALDVCRWNAKQNGVDQRVCLVQQDILKGFPQADEGMLFDVIVSNPPYIPTNAIDELQTEVKDYEPRTALDGGQDGLLFYRSLVSEMHKYLKPGGLAAFEVGHNQSDDVAQLMEKSGYYDNIKIIRDLAGIKRVVSARKLIVPQLE
ncbi:MAG: peptide chain release factor N(5)-glutamine methyltransferase [Clostridiaceae bacterium]|nr:peptide chain release factor N(5)-glutamine methyltransferase [Clostridiaceae bacterium]